MRNPTVCMWTEALEQLDQADRMQRQCFQLGARCDAGLTWEPPVDVFETDGQFIMVAALPGVEAEQLFVGLDDAVVSVLASPEAGRLGQYAREQHGRKKTGISPGRASTSTSTSASTSTSTSTA